MSTGSVAATGRASVTAPLRDPSRAPAGRGHVGLPDVPTGPAGLRPAAPPLTRAAREGADMVGEACVVWTLAGDGGRLEPAAAHHRDKRMRSALATFVEQGTLAPEGNWPGQVVAHAAPVRVRRARAAELGLAGGAAPRRANALLAPVLDDGRAIAVIAALRETREPEYSLREEVVLRRIAARTAAWLGIGAERGGPDGTDGAGGGAGGGGGDGDGGPPDGDDPGWAPPSTWLMDHVGVGVWITDRAGTTTYVNTTMTALLGVPAQRVVGRSMGEFVEDLPQMLRGEYCMDAERCDRRLTQPDGRHTWLEMTSAPLVDDAGRRRGTINTAIDVTARKQIELAARKRVPRAHRRA